MQQSVARFLRANAADPGYELAVERVIAANPALQNATNGFNNTDEALRHLQSALVHLIIARKNGEGDEICAMQNSIDYTLGLIDEITDMQREVYLSRMANLANMRLRFQSVWNTLTVQQLGELRPAQQAQR